MIAMENEVATLKTEKVSFYAVFYFFWNKILYTMLIIFAIMIKYCVVLKEYIQTLTILLKGCVLPKK